ncbi:hypothetical protein BO82DRAFT_157704 [Aspergillus uvarum CBS 121591]|uniref:Uncharacterized protein n=1 Tax=Aspergillus uvarum CBS 121591 TaxID=1448315 RepID=A0A319C380_9EURO|nr:hypothetical protein BO82DRAFT_157704 [Aspergillus uvarum CBS 121591]PYH78310.1 hypothetical protein BO82DRAFT_157704 [Aspergillus uvarum CBS 121591]
MTLSRSSRDPPTLTACPSTHLLWDMMSFLAYPAPGVNVCILLWWLWYTARTYMILCLFTNKRLKIVGARVLRQVRCLV